VGWKTDKRWSDRFLPAIKRILGEHLIAEPPMEEDAEHNTDLIVLRLDAVRIACRVRQYKYLSGYGDEFTIRTSRPSGIKTELTKIVEGWGDYLFYGFSNPEETALQQWFLGDLKALRLYYNRALYKGRPHPWFLKDNLDGSSAFTVFKRDDIPGFIVAQSDYTPTVPLANSQGQMYEACIM